LNYVKFGIFNIRKQLALEVNPPILEIMREGIMPILLNIMDLYLSHETIVVKLVFL
jgi:hypothetical protein